MPTKNNYTAENIQVLDPIKAIRLRPEMYIGSRDNPFHLYIEIISNSIDEFLNGYLTSTIDVFYDDKTNKITIKDSGRGLPIDIHPKFKKPTIEILATTTHSGGKFDKKSFKISAGLNGVGLTCANALSNYMKIVSTRDGYDYSLEFKKGKVVSEYKKIKSKNKFKSGTLIEFIPDDTIFENPKFNIDQIKSDLNLKSYINGGLKINFKSNKETKSFYNENGILDYINTFDSKPINKPIEYKFTDKDENKYEMVFNWVNTDEENIQTFVNGIKVTGTCETGYKMGLTTAIINFIKNNNLLGKKYEKLDIKGEDIRMGINCIMNIRHSNPRYKNQIKDEISNTELTGLFKKETNTILSKWLEENQEIGKRICNRIIQFAKGRTEANKVKDKIISINNSSAGLNFSEKFSDCTSNNPEECELFIAEGKSAGGNIKKCRISKFQAVLPLRGKPLNIYGAKDSTVLNNEEFKELIKIIFGTTNIKEINFHNIKNNIRYHKILFASDADFDGLHIQSLLALFFWEKFRWLYDLGYIYVCLPPKYRTVSNGKFIYFKNDYEKNKYTFDLSKKIVKLNTKEVTLKKFIDNMVEYENNFNIIKNKYSIADDVLNIFLFDDEKEIFRKIKKMKLDVKDEMVTGIYNGIWHDFNYIELNDDIYNYNLLDIIPITERFEFCDDKNNIINSNSTIIDCIRYINKKTNVKFDYFKGLGEASPEELFDTTINPETRDIYQLKPKSKEDIDKIMKDLFGNNTNERKKFIKDTLNLAY